MFCPNNTSHHILKCSNITKVVVDVIFIFLYIKKRFELKTSRELTLNLVELQLFICIYHGVYVVVKAKGTIECS